MAMAGTATLAAVAALLAVSWTAAEASLPFGLDGDGDGDLGIQDEVANDKSNEICKVKASQINS